MDYKLFGRTGVYISPLVLGCMMFGQKTDLEDTCKIIDYAHSRCLRQRCI